MPLGRPLSGRPLAGRPLHGRGLGERGQVGGSPPAFNPLSLSPTVLLVARIPTLFQTTDTSSPVTTDGQTVGRENDLTTNGNNPVQSTAGLRPTFNASGNLSWLTCDGSDDQLALDFTAVTQPFEIVAAIRLIAAAGTENMIGGGVTNNNGAIFSAPGTVNLFAGSTVTGPALTDNTDVVVTARFNGASSRVAIDNGSYSTGDAGTASSTGISIGQGPGGAGASNMRFHGCILVPRLLTTTEIANLRTYFGRLQGRVL